jgi:hypothetical protein
MGSPVPKLALQICLLSASVVFFAVAARAEGCPTLKDDIATDRSAVTNSDLVVPVGSLQSENGVNTSARDDGRTIDGSNTRWRFGVAPCLELLVELPTYFATLDRAVADYDQAIRPDYVAAFYNRGLALADKQEYAKAI